MSAHPFQYGYRTTERDVRAFNSLIAHFSGDEPVCGWTDVSKVLPLSDSELAIVLRYEPDITDDVVISVEALAESLANKHSGQTTREWVARHVMEQVVNACREVVWKALQDYEPPVDDGVDEAYDKYKAEAL